MPSSLLVLGDGKDLRLVLDEEFVSSCFSLYF